MNDLPSKVPFLSSLRWPRRLHLAPRTGLFSLMALGLAVPIAGIAPPIGPASHPPVAPVVAPIGPAVDPLSVQQLQDVFARDSYFAPQTITVTVGSVVRWQNAGTYRHTTTSDDGYWSWELVPGSSFSVRFLSPATYRYHCMFHVAQGMIGKVVVVTGGAPLPTPPPYPTGQPAAGRVVFDYPPDEQLQQPTDLYTLDIADSTSLKRLTTTSDVAEVQPSWAPDRSAVIFSASAAVDGSADGPWSLWVLDVNSGMRHEITAGPEHYEPDWSPDGTRILYTSIGRNNGVPVSSEIAVVAPDGNGYRPVLRMTGASAGIVNPSWSPDGRQIAFVLSSTLIGGELYVMNADGSNAHRIFNHSGWDDIEPEWSPDGRYIAFASGPNQGTVSRHDIWVADMVRGLAGAVAQNPGWDLRRPSWSPDSTQLIFTARYQTQPARWALYLVPATGGTVTGPLSVGVEPDWASGAAASIPSPTPGATPTSATPPPFPTPPPPEPTEPGPSATFPAPPTFPPPEATPTSRSALAAHVYLAICFNGVSAR